MARGWNSLTKYPGLTYEPAILSSISACQRTSALSLSYGQQRTRNPSKKDDRLINSRRESSAFPDQSPTPPKSFKEELSKAYKTGLYLHSRCCFGSFRFSVPERLVRQNSTTGPNLHLFHLHGILPDIL